MHVVVTIELIPVCNVLVVCCLPFPVGVNCDSEWKGGKAVGAKWLVHLCFHSGPFNLCQPVLLW